MTDNISKKDLGLAYNSKIIWPWICGSLLGSFAWWFVNPMLEELLQLIFNGGISATGLYIIGGPIQIAFMLVGAWKMMKVVEASNNNAYLNGVADGVASKNSDGVSEQ